MHRTIKSYVLRTGRVSTRQQQALNEWLTDYELPESEKKWDLQAIFERDAPTIVEIGFGMGASLFTMAQSRPEMNFIGIEVHRAGIGGLAAELHDHQLTNVRIASFDAVKVFKEHLPDDSIAGIQIFFPDPWPKKRHHKRRLVQPEFVQQMLPALQRQGFMHCATDWEEYAEHMLDVLSSEPQLMNTAVTGYAERPATRPLTKFEQRGLKLGHGVWDLLFIKK